MDFFRGRTAAVFAGYYDTKLWNQLILQVCHAEPAVHHAVVAVASLHESLDNGSEDAAMSQQYGLQHYTKALAGLNRYIITANKSIDIVLICCVLFISYESLRGNCEAAAHHLHSGLRILSNRRSNLSISPVVDDDLVPLFTRLHVQSQSILDTTLLVNDLEPQPVIVPRKFLSLGEARDCFYSLMSLVFNFVEVEASKHKACQTPVPEDEYSALAMQATYTSLLGQWQVSFDAFLTRTGAKMCNRELSGAMLLRMHHTSVLVVLQNAHTLSQCCYDEYLPQFEKIILLAKSLIKAAEVTKHSPGRHMVWIDMGIIAPLFFTATKCRDPLLRREAARLMSSPRREGTWDGEASCHVAERVIAMEEEGLPKVEVAQDILESSRIYELRPENMEFGVHRVRLLFYTDSSRLGARTIVQEEYITW